MNKKTWNRLNYIFTNTAFRLFPPLSQLIISLLIIHLEDVSLWGQYVKILIIPNLAMAFLNWGNHTYLLKTFSAFPDSIGQKWQESLWTRLPLFLLFSLGYLLSPLSSALKAGIILWVFYRFLYKSMDVIIQYTKSFRLALIMEMIGFVAILGSLLYFKEILDLSLVIWVVTILGLFKLFVHFWVFRKLLFRNVNFNWKKQYFRGGSSYLLLDLSGLLEARMDLYCVAWFASDATLGKYQVLVTLFLYVKSAAHFILQPFIKSIFRSSKQVFTSISKKMLFAGIFLVVSGAVVSYFIIHVIYSFHLPWYFFAIGALYALPFYYYNIEVYRFFRNGWERAVILIAIVGSLINLGLNVILIPVLGILGAFIASTLSQWFLLGYYGLAVKKAKKSRE